MRSNENVTVRTPVKAASLVLSSAMGVVLSVLLVFILSAAGMLAGNPEEFSLVSAFIAAGLSAAFAGARNAGRSDMKGILSGLLGGLGFYLFILVISFSACYKLFHSLDALWLLLLSLGAGAAGGIISKNRTNRTTRR